MDKLVLDMLTYSRIARSEIQIRPTDLDLLVHDIVQHYPEMQQPRAHVTIHSPLGKVLAHEPSLVQTISNLLVNAVKFVDVGTIPQVEVKTEHCGDKVRLWITDNGIGITPELQSRIFGIFERATQNSRYEGTGIGLAIVRKAVEIMGGTMGFKSDGKKGSSFWVELPAASTQPADA